MGKDLATLLREHPNVVQMGQSTLTSGVIAAYKLNIESAVGNAYLRERMLDELSVRVPPKTSRIVSTGDGGNLLGMALACRLGLDYANLKKGRAYGAVPNWGGATPQRDEIVLPFDDVYTTGGTIDQIMNACIHEGAAVLRGLVLVRRTLEPESDIEYVLTDTQIVLGVEPFPIL
jgi:orotate phosphoribosyltransferase